MGTKQLITLVIACLLVTGCTREVVVSPGEKTEEKVPVSLRILFDSSVTARDVWEYEKFFPGITDEERTVSSILLVVFKNEVLEQYSYFDENNFEQDPEDFSISLEDKEGEDLLELEPGPHYFYAILNLPDEDKDRLVADLSGKEGEMSRSSFERIVVEKSLDELVGDGEHFIMTNSIPPSLRGIYSKEQIENNDELSNQVHISVGRAVGKISFAYVASEIQTGELHGKLRDIRYIIAHNPPSMYLMPVIEDNILLTPHYTDKSVAGTFTPSPKDPNIIEREDWLVATTPARVNAGDELHYGYCVENNNRSPLRSTSTMVLIKAKFEPAVWLNPDGTPGTPAIDDTFYRIGCYNTQGVLYAYEQGYYNAEPSDEIIKQYENSGNAVSEYKVAKYPNGITYYGFWPKQSDQYMVKRNNYYKIAITHVHGAGVPDPGDVVDPDVDPEDPATYGRLSVYAVTWIEENVEINLGEPDAEDNDSINVGGTNPDIKDWEDEEQEKELNEGEKNTFN